MSKNTIFPLNSFPTSCMLFCLCSFFHSQANILLQKPISNMRHINPLIGIQNLSLIWILFMLLTTTTSTSQSHRPYKFTYHHGKEIVRQGQGPTYPKVKEVGKVKEVAKGKIAMEIYPTGSNLPDCSHACGPCFPCIRVMVTFTCAVESCPVVYRCFCKGKYFHVPSY